jgi:hypothetical protein
MKFLVLALLFSSTSYALERTAEAVIRVGKRAKIRPVKLKDLTSKNCFDGKYFKIMKESTNETVCNDDSEMMRLKAATTYYHLTVARDYYVNDLKYDYVKNQVKKIRVRIDMDRIYHPYVYMAHESQEGEYNNARTIPAGEAYPERGVEAWDTELWFMPSKRIHRSELNVHNGSAGIQSFLRMYRRQTHVQNLNKFVASLLRDSKFQQPDALSNVIRLVGSSLLMEFLYKYNEPIMGFFSRRYYYLETALVPEIIYHEYTHIALADRVSLVDRDAIVEGMADYFATSIAKSPLLAKHIKKYNVVNGKDATNNTNYSLLYELDDYANADLVLSLLWNLGNIFPKDKMDDFVLSMTSHLGKSRIVRKDLVNAILTSCRQAKWCHFDHLNKVKTMLYKRKI